MHIYFLISPLQLLHGRSLVSYGGGLPCFDRRAEGEAASVRVLCYYLAEVQACITRRVQTHGPNLSGIAGLTCMRSLFISAVALRPLPPKWTLFYSREQENGTS